MSSPAFCTEVEAAELGTTFYESASELPNRAMAERAVTLSQRIAQSLGYGYQLRRKPDEMPASLPLRETRPSGAVQP